MKRRTAPKGRPTTRAPRVPEARDIVARIEFALEAIESGDHGVAHAVLRDLVDELPAADSRARCPECGLRMWPGQLPKHRSITHLVDPFASAA